MKRTGNRIALGLDFGTESVRAVLVTLCGCEVGDAVAGYRHGQITRELVGTGELLPSDFALQHPNDWIESSSRAVKRAVRAAAVDAADIVGIGVDFTSCTMLPCQADGTPLCLTERFAERLHAWPKLWKHHGAQSQTDRINQVARTGREQWLKRYGGVVGLEWFFPKVLEVIEKAPAVYDATDIWLEGGDWYVWQLVGAEELTRSTCQAGYKGLWSEEDGFPSPRFFRKLNPRMEHVVRDKMPGVLRAPGESAGELCPAMARRMGLSPGIPVSTAVIDAHAGVPGAGVSQMNTLVMVLGTSSCHMLMHREACDVPGVAGIVRGGILPGSYGYETGQAAVGDAFAWLMQMVGHRDFRRLDEEAGQLPPGSDGVMCIDWFNGCRTPLMDGRLAGAFTGLTLNHGSAHLYRALLEATGLGLRWIVDVLETGGVPVKRLVATGGLPHHNPLLMQIYADVLGQSISIPPSERGSAVGAAVLGALAAGKRATGFASTTAAVRSMAAVELPRIVRPHRGRHKVYDRLYQRYRDLTSHIANG